MERQKTIGDRLRAARVARGETQEEVGLRAGLSQSVISRQERGMVSRVDAVTAHAAALGLSAELLVLEVRGE